MSAPRSCQGLAIALCMLALVVGSSEGRLRHQDSLSQASRGGRWGSRLASAPAAASCAMPNMRPPAADRKFVSSAIDSFITTTVPRFKDSSIATLFANTLPNTLDTTVYSHTTAPLDTFVITGDIAAMWLRDSANQVYPYVPFVGKDAGLDALVRGVMARHVHSVLLDPYANAFNLNASTGPGPHQADSTTRRAYAGTTVDGMTNNIFERKYELDSLMNVLSLANRYYNQTGSTTPFGASWVKAVSLIIDTLKLQQRSTAQMQGSEDYTFQRLTQEPTDSLEHGVGPPAAFTGMVKTCFRPSDDHTKFPFNIPSNAFASVELARVAKILTAVGQSSLAASATALSQQIDAGIKQYGIMNHPVAGTVYAYEVDGFGNAYFMDDANVPSLLSLPYLGYVSRTNSLYLATRAGVLSAANPYWFNGTAGSGTGGPHNGYGYIWPMSIMMEGLTAADSAEVAQALTRAVASSACTGLMHESFMLNNIGSFTRPWFAWANSLFGELIIHISQEYPSLIF